MFPAAAPPRVVFPPLPLPLPQAFGEEQGGLGLQRGMLLSGGGGDNAELQDGDGFGAKTTVPAAKRQNSFGVTNQILYINQIRKFGRDAES